MLNSIEIKNYKNLKSLRINSLGRVNLITGKNNTGKSTLLEAISIYASKGDPSWLYQILEERGEFVKSRDNSKDTLDNNIKSFASLFSDRKVPLSSSEGIFIGSYDDTLFGKNHSTIKSIQFRFVRFVEETINQVDPESDERIFRGRKRTVIDDNVSTEKAFDFQMGLEIRASGSSFIFPLDNNIRVMHRMSLRAITEANNFQFIRTKNIDREVNGKLWDDIALSKKEEFVIQALRIIEPNLDRIAFVSDEDLPRRRTPVIKLRNSDAVLPLKSMGDGVNRIFTIILGLVNSDKGYFLIDEFENGLHYSVQENLWKLIFELSHLLNIQVFATTHSFDCIVSFSNILKKHDVSNGKLIRLESSVNGINPIEFNEQELRIAAENFIETR